MKTTINNQYYTNFFLVVMAGILWSFGSVVVKHMSGGIDSIWHYLIFRGITIATICSLYLLVKERKTFKVNLQKICVSSLVGGLFLSIAFVSYIASITQTTAAVTLLCLSLMPFISALFAFLLLSERINKVTMIALVLALTGTGIMVTHELERGSLIGLIFGLCSAAGFAGFTVSLRWNATPSRFMCVLFGGLFCVLISGLVIFMQDKLVIFPLKNVLFSIAHGILVGVGLILYSAGSKRLPAVELSLLSLLEVIGGILWAWVPFFGVHETPEINIILGGGIILASIILQSFSPSYEKYASSV